MARTPLTDDGEAQAPILRALVAAGVVAAIGVLVLAIAVLLDADSDGADPARTRPTTTSPRPPTTIPPAEMSLVSPGDEGTLFRWGEVDVAVSEIARIDAAVATGTPPVLLDDSFVAAQEDAGLSLALLRAQLEMVTARLLALTGTPGEGPPAAVVARPIFDDEQLEVAVLVLNPTAEPRRLVHVDLAVRDALGSVTTTTRFFGGLGIEVPAGGAYFNVVAFASDQTVGVSTDLTDFADFSYEATVEWQPAS